MKHHPRAPIRLTKRGRAVVGLFVGLMALTGVGLVNTAVAADTQAVRTVVVQEGESLWSIARALSPQADPRVVVYEMKRLNALTSSVVHVGQSLQVAEPEAP